MRFQVYTDRGGKYRWRLRARNGQIVATSHQSFANKFNAGRACRKIWKTLGYEYLSHDLPEVEYLSG